MKTIYKYTLNDGDTLMPAGAEILSVQLQRDKFTIWALVDIHAPRLPRKFEIFGTGETLPEGSRQHLATLQQGELVWHIFERLS